MRSYASIPLSRYAGRIAALIITALLLSLMNPVGAQAATGTATVTGAVTVDGEYATEGCLTVYRASDESIIAEECDLSADYSLEVPAGEAFVLLVSGVAGFEDWWDEAGEVTLGEGETYVADFAYETPVTGALAGTVTVGGEAAVDGCIELYDLDENWVDSTCVDQNGEYLFEGVDAQELYVDVWGFANASNGRLDTTATVLAGETTTFDIDLAAATTLSGVVTIEGGDIAVNGCVSAYDAASGDFLDSSCVDEFGAYAFADLSAESVKLNLFNFDNAVGAWFDGAQSRTAATPVSLEAGSANVQDVVLAPAGTLSGSVTLTNGEVALEGCVTAFDADGDWLGEGCVDDQGHYEILGLPAGDVYLYMQAFDWGQDEYLGAVEIREDATSTTVVASVNTTLDIQVSLASVLTGTISVEELGLAANGNVSVYDDRGDWQGSASISEDGTFRVEGLPDGNLYARVTDVDWALDRWYGDVEDEAYATPIVAIAGEEQSIDMTLPGAGALTVTFPQELADLDADVCVTLYDLDYNWVDNDCGSESITLTGVPGGDVTLEARISGGPALGFLGAVTDFYSASFVAVEVGQTTTAAFEPAVEIGTGIVSGTVTMPGGEPAMYGNVSAYTPDGFRISQTSPDENGHYSLGYLPAGDVTLKFEYFEGVSTMWLGGVTRRADATYVTLAEGEQVTQDVELLDGGTIAITIDGTSANGCIWVQPTDPDVDVYASECGHGSGTYLLTGLPAGEYTVEVSFDDALTEYYGGGRYWEDAAPVEVVVGETTEISMTLTRASTVEGYVSLDGAPALGGYVQATDADGNWLGSDQVSGSGFFSIDKLPDGQVFLQLTDFDGAPSQWYDAVYNVYDATPVTLPYGGTTNVGTIALALGGSISGTVTVGGEISTGGCVTAWDLDQWEELGTACVDENGHYTIDGLAGGDIYLEFTGFDGASDAWYGGGVEYDSTPVQVGDTADMDLQAAQMLSGQVTVTGGAAALDGLITAYDLNYELLDSTWVDENGAYTLQVPAGDVKLRLRYFSNGASGWYDGVEYFDDATVVNVPQGGTSLDIELEQTGSISGNVTLANGEAARNGSVSAYDEDENYVADGWADENGDFVINGLPAGSYRLLFENFDNAARTWHGGSSFGDAASVSVVGGETTTVDPVLPVPVVLQGQVTVAGGEPATGGYIDAYDLDYNEVAFAWVDDEGYYSLQMNPGDVKLYASGYDNAARGWFDGVGSFYDATTVTVPNEGLTLDIQLQQTGSIAGALTVPGGEPATNGWVYAYDGTWDWVGEGWADDEGNFFIDGLPAGSYRLWFEGFENAAKGWYGGASFDEATLVTVAGGETTTVDAELGAAATLTGTVTMEGGGFAGYGCVEVFDANQDWLGSTCVEEDGTFSLGGLSTGNVYASFYGFDGADEWYQDASSFGGATPIDLVAGESTDISAELAVPGTLEVTMSVPAENAPAGDRYCVTARTTDGSYLASACGEGSVGDGEVLELTGLGTGAVVLSFSAMSYEGWSPSTVQYHSNALNAADALAVNAVSGETVAVTFPVQPVGGISGTVTRSDDSLAEAPTARREVVVYSQTGAGDWEPVECSECGGESPTALGYTDAAGDYLIDDLPAGEYKVGFRDHSSNTAFLEEQPGEPGTYFAGASSLDDASVVTVTAGSVTDGVDGILATEQVATTASFSGRITGLGDNGAADAVLTLISGLGSVEVTTDPDGYYSADIEVDPGDVVQAKLEGLGVFKWTGVNPGDVHTRDLALPSLAQYTAVSSTVDFTGDGEGDGLWQKQAANQYRQWIVVDGVTGEHLTAAAGWGTAGMTWVEDYDGNGAADLSVVLENTGRRSEIWVWSPSTDSVEYVSNLGWDTGSVWDRMDVDGDGDREIVAIRPNAITNTFAWVWDDEDGAGTVDVRTPTTGEVTWEEVDGTPGAELVLSGSWADRMNVVAVVDLADRTSKVAKMGYSTDSELTTWDRDGDGTVEFEVIRQRADKKSEIWRWDGMTATPAYFTTGWGVGNTILRGDVNGDDVEDTVIGRNRTGQAQEWWVLDGVTGAFVYTTGNWDDGVESSLDDVTGDGIADIVTFKARPGKVAQFAVISWTGTGYTTVWHNLGWDATSYRTADVTEDGTSELLSYRDNGESWRWAVKDLTTAQSWTVDTAAGMLP
ncbi:carboxypeptidase-like regulatory domain-containing protein [Demequina sp. NBRC 110051]|uniref:carboxypeptidase-like regulatory domain-containing protein n=1 Tax=Demequina sp. NBRC 110051 TaxID=1570340 RepID=UPI000A066571|nr:carboxypeptidase-like regulatory domain-containing protein [Demequina sp. NBRC 110051]